MRNFFCSVLVMSFIQTVRSEVPKSIVEYPLTKATAEWVLWPAAHAIDDSQETFFSSMIAQSEWGGDRMLSAWLPEQTKINTVIFQARMSSKGPISFPASYRINLTSSTNSKWIEIGSFSTQPDASGRVEVDLGKDYTTHGVMIVPETLQKDDSGNYVFQLASLKLGYDETKNKNILGAHEASKKLKAPAGYALYFQEEFDDVHDGAPNPKFWDYDLSTKNAEAQCYTKNRENVRVETRTIDGDDNGLLVLQLKKESIPCPQDKDKVYGYTSGAIHTRKGFGRYLLDLPHGRYEIRAKIPSGRGTWPAIWLVGDGPLGAWPHSGEIDIMEAVGFDEEVGKYVLYSTIHRPTQFGWPNEWGTTGQSMTYFLTEPPSAKFHTWVMEWEPESIKFYVDGNLVTDLAYSNEKKEKRSGFIRDEFKGGTDPAAWPYSMSVPGTEFDFILNLAWGGSWGGVKGLDDSIFSEGKNVEMLVDYVRIYKKVH